MKFMKHFYTKLRLSKYIQEWLLSIFILEDHPSTEEEKCGGQYIIMYLIQHVTKCRGLSL